MKNLVPFYFTSPPHLKQLSPSFTILQPYCPAFEKFLWLFLASLACFLSSGVSLSVTSSGRPSLILCSHEIPLLHLFGTFNHSNLFFSHPHYNVELHEFSPFMFCSPNKPRPKDNTLHTFCVNV